MNTTITTCLTCVVTHPHTHTHTHTPHTNLYTHIHLHTNQYTPSRFVRTPSLSSMLHPLRVAPSRFTLGMCTHCSMAPYSGNTGLVRFPLARHCYTVTHYTGIVIHTALTPYSGNMGLLRFPLAHHCSIHPPSPPLLYTLYWLSMVSNRLVPHATSEGFLIFSFTMEVCIIWNRLYHW